jgi:hypothetical protein
MNGRKTMGTGWGGSLLKSVPLCAVLILALCVFAPAAQAKGAPGPAGGGGLYVVTADVVPPVRKNPRRTFPGWQIFGISRISTGSSSTAIT